MYIGLEEPLPYSPPWLDVEASRRHWWRSSNALRIAYFYEFVDAHTFRYRVFNMVQAINADPSLGAVATWFTRADLEQGLAFIDAADVVVLSRVRYDGDIGRIAVKAEATGTALIFDIDDLLFDIDHVHHLVDALDARPSQGSDWDQWFSLVARMRATLSLCHGALTSTPALTQQLERCAPNISVATVGNFLNRGQSEASEAIVRLKAAAGFQRDDTITIGYLSGTPTHRNDFAVAAPALGRLLRSKPHVALRIVGHDAIPPGLEALSPQIERVPLQDFFNLQRVTAQCELTIAPLRRSTFTECKSELKYFEPAAVLCPVIATPTGVFRAAITHGADGLLANDSDWLDALMALCDQVETTHDAPPSMAERARANALQRYGWDKQAASIVSTVSGLLPP